MEMPAWWCYRLCTLHVCCPMAPKSLALYVTVCKAGFANIGERGWALPCGSVESCARCALYGTVPVHTVQDVTVAPVALRQLCF